MSFSISIRATQKDDVREKLEDAADRCPQDQQVAVADLVDGLATAVEDGAFGDAVTISASGHAYIQPDNAGYVDAYANITIKQAKVE